MSSDIGHLIGIPFLDGGRNPAIGLDCWGLVMKAAEVYGYEFPDFDISAMDSGEIDAAVKVQNRWEKVIVPVPGCVVAFAIDPEMPDAVQHFGVYVGRGMFLHTRKKTMSVLDRIDHPFWSNKLRGIYKWAG